MNSILTSSDLSADASHSIQDPKALDPLGSIAAATLGVGLIGVIGKHESDKLPGSYAEQIAQALGQSGLHASKLSVNAREGTFTLHEGKGRDEEICDGIFSSPDHITADIDASLDCTPVDGNAPIILQQ